MAGTPRHDRAGMGLGGVVGFAKIHKGYWLRPPPDPHLFRPLPFRKLLMATSLMTVRKRPQPGGESKTTEHP